MKPKTCKPLSWRLRVPLALVAAGMGLALTLSPAHGELLFSDSFDYPVGLLDGNGPPPDSPPGQGPWIALGRTPQVTSPGLEFPGIGSAGNAVTLGDDGVTGDTASATITPVGVGGSGVVWISYLVHQNTIKIVDGYVIVTFNDGFGPAAPQFGVIFASKMRFGIDNAVDPRERALTGVQAGFRTFWLVAKLDFDAGMQFLFVNPPRMTEPPESRAQATLPMRSEFQTSGFDRIVFKEGYKFNSSAFTVDELRVGTTFADLTP